ncbi:biotin transporter BioY [Hathewaya histolytica]|uniref:biotin transporter BioY n=1 Tax=Hathewaya histolytica TaxID=1498 RepID=UPI003B684637
MDNKVKFDIRDITLCALFAAIIAVLAQISIPIKPVSFTFQIFGVALAGIILGPKKGFISVMVYILLGSIGVPVFAGMNGGIQVLVGPTGGFLIGFPFMALIVGYFSERNGKVSYIFLGAIIGLVLTYLIGSMQLAFVAKMSFWKALWVGVIPFVILDLFKIAIVVFIGCNIRKKLINRVRYN